MLRFRQTAKAFCNNTIGSTYNITFRSCSTQKKPVLIIGSSIQGQTIGL